jgi:hypothetical protein
LVESDVDDMTDVYLVDTVAHHVWLASGTVNGLPGMTNPARYPPGAPQAACPVAHAGEWVSSNHLLSWDPSVSGNGRYVAFASMASNLVPGDTNLSADIFVFDSKRDATTRVSVNSHGDQATRGGLPASPGPGWSCSTTGGLVAFADSWGPSIDGTGRRVAFVSQTDNLVPNGNLYPNVYVRDLRKKTTQLVSAPFNGFEPECSNYYVSLPGIGLCRGNDSDDPAISFNGRHVAFDSWASNLVLGDSNDTRDVFVRDLSRRRTVLVSVATGGAQVGSNKTGNGNSTGGDFAKLPGHLISANGRLVAWHTTTAGAVPAGCTGVFVHDVRTGRTENVTVTSSGECDVTFATWPQPSISGTGRFVVYGAYPGPGATVYDRATGALTPTPQEPKGDQVWSNAGDHEIDFLGRYISFAGCPPGTKLCGNGFPNDRIYLLDRGPVLGVGGFGGERVPRPPDEGLCVSGVCIPPLGVVSVPDEISDVAPGITRSGGNIYRASLAPRPQLGDLFVKEELQAMPAVRGAPLPGNPGVLYGFDFSVGRTDYEVRSQRVPGLDYDDGGFASFGLFRKDPITGMYTDHVATLRGGYGTTGDAVVFSIPLHLVGLENGVRLGHAKVFTALGSYLTGPVTILDEVSIK